jgi:hypothetical protein
MSAQGGTIAGRATAKLPVRSIAVLLAIVTAVAIAMTAVRLADRDAGVEPAVSNQESSMPVQRLYPEGFGQAISDKESSMPVQRLYPGGFGSPDR